MKSSPTPQLPIVTEEFLTSIFCNVAKPTDQMPDEENPTNEIAVKINKHDLGTKIKLDPNNLPVMSPVLEAQVHATIAMYANFKKWREWGLKSLRKGGAVVLFEGPPGTGKTIIAEYMSAKVGKGLVRLNMKDVGGKAPGDTERRVAEVFQNANLQGRATIFLDECDTLLIARDRISSDGQYMVGVINELLTQIAQYPGLVVLATNRSGMLDPALARRLLAKIHIGRPEIPERLRLWKQKIPKHFPLKPSTVQFDALASIMLTGAEIETAIILEASDAINTDRLPTFATLQSVAKSLVTE